MFTGIVTDVGRVRAVAPSGPGHDALLTIETALATDTMTLGASIACAGVCLTVVDKGPGWFAVEASAETLVRTTLGEWQAGRRVNLERPLRLGDELGGHLVSGHVDGTARAVERRAEGGSLRFVFEAPAVLGRFIAAKGSVALDGVSLTVNAVEDMGDVTRFTVNIIPTTGRSTTFGELGPGARVNLEVDTLVRYVLRARERS
ncbi:MAG: riboflavin synthase [Pseudomonadota bacterium]